MGYDIKRFRESDVNEEFICPICQDVLEDPILVENCEHLFCRQCINEWLQKSETKLCPIDRTEINESTLRPPQRSFRNLITSLLISCDFQTNGCEEWVKIEELSTHAMNCVFNPVLMHQKIECPSGCGAIVKRCGLIDNHNCVIFLKDLIRDKNNIIQDLRTQNNYLTKELENKDNILRLNDEKLRKLSENNDSKDLIIREMKVNNEKLKKLSENNDLKDVIISELKVEIEKLKKMKDEMIELIKRRQRSFSVSSQNESDFSRENSEDGNLIELFNELETNNEMSDSQIETIDKSVETSVENQKLVETLRAKGLLINTRVMKAMLSIDRGLFSPSAASYALNHIRSIGYGAHTGPSTYEAKLLQYLEPHLTNSCKVLDIGSGTGYLTACIANMIQPNGKVIGIEHIPQLVLLSRETIDKHYPNLLESGRVKLIVADGRFGFANEAPYDLIFVEGLTRRVPQRLIDQLKPGGSIVVPIGGREKDMNLEQITKQINGDVVRLVLCDDWTLMKENTLDLLEDKKIQLRSGWRVKLGF
jgi:protein-L-isoaspartate(D-aspartate) O-methyltransferase